MDTLHSAIKRCTKKEVKEQKRALPEMLAEWLPLTYPSIPSVLKPQLWGMHLSSNTCPISHKRIFLMSTQLNESDDGHTLQSRELNTRCKSITIHFLISEHFYTFYPVLPWQPTTEFSLVCCYSSWCGSCNTYRRTVPRQLEDSWGIPNSTRTLTFWVYWLSPAVC